MHILDLTQLKVAGVKFKHHHATLMLTNVSLNQRYTYKNKNTELSLWTVQKIDVCPWNIWSVCWQANCVDNQSLPIAAVEKRQKHMQLCCSYWHFLLMLFFHLGVSDKMEHEHMHMHTHRNTWVIFLYLQLWMCVLFRVFFCVILLYKMICFQSKS